MAEPKMLSALKLGAGALGAVTAAVVGSHFSDQGTLWGVATGSIILSGSAAVYEHLMRRGPALLGRAKHLTPALAGKIAAGTLAAAVLGAGGAYGATTLIEKGTGKTLHGITTNTHDYGTTLGGSRSTPPSAPTTAPTDTGLPSASATPSPSPTVTPTLSESPSPTVAQTPTSTPTESPSSTPTPVPTQVATAPSP